MKTKLRSISKMALSLVLTLCMLFACVNVGTIDAKAWDVDDNNISYNNGYSNDGWKIYLYGTDYYNIWNTELKIKVRDDPNLEMVGKTCLTTLTDLLICSESSLEEHNRH